MAVYRVASGEDITCIPIVKILKILPSEERFHGPNGASGVYNEEEGKNYHLFPV